jgi:viroplasmin and RNaseH domain-containing protein
MDTLPPFEGELFVVGTINCKPHYHRIESVEAAMDYMMQVAERWQVTHANDAHTDLHLGVYKDSCFVEYEDEDGNELDEFYKTLPGLKNKSTNVMSAVYTHHLGFRATA